MFHQPKAVAVMTGKTRRSYKASSQYRLSVNVHVARDSPSTCNVCVPFDALLSASSCSPKHCYLGLCRNKSLPACSKLTVGALRRRVEQFPKFTKYMLFIPETYCSVRIILCKDLMASCHRLRTIYFSSRV